jgi:hypothetical protein
MCLRLLAAASQVLAQIALLPIFGKRGINTLRSAALSSQGLLLGPIRWQIDPAT